jgi:hypothetical protein
MPYNEPIIEAAPLLDIEAAPLLEEILEPTGVMSQILARYKTDRELLERKYPLRLSPVRQDRMQRFYEGWKRTLEQVAFEPLRQEERIDYLLFRNHLDYRLRQLDLQAQRSREMEPLLPFARALLGLEERRLQMKWTDPAADAALLNDVETQLEDLLKREEPQREEGSEEQTGDLPYKPTLLHRASRAVADLRETLKSWFTFYHGYDPLFSWWVNEPYKAVDQALKRYVDLLEKQIGTATSDEGDIIGDPLGRDALLVELHFEMIPYTPEELIAIANRELAWCEAEMRRAARELGFGENGQAALEHVKTLHQEPGKQPEMIRELALEAIDFLDRYDLLTIPPLARETWRMEMMSPEKQKVNPFFLGGEVIQVSFPTDTMSHEQKRMSLRGNNRHFARATVQHELIPGHHLQGHMMTRYRTYRQPLGTPFWIEGWALYWEMLLWEMGFPESPENRIGMLFWRMHRCVRIIFSLSFHLEQMTPKECIEMLVEKVGHERANATAEVRRSFNGDYPPLYQCAYMLGGLQLMALRRELVDTGRMPQKVFHDSVLKENSIPIEMVRASLTQQPLSTDFVSHWRFYSE